MRLNYEKVQIMSRDPQTEGRSGLRFSSVLVPGQSVSITGFLIMSVSLECFSIGSFQTVLRIFTQFWKIKDLRIVDKTVIVLYQFQNTVHTASELPIYRLDKISSLIFDLF